MITLYRDGKRVVTAPAEDLLAMTRRAGQAPDERSATILALALAAAPIVDGVREASARSRRTRWSVVESEVAS